MGILKRIFIFTLLNYGALSLSFDSFLNQKSDKSGDSDNTSSSCYDKDVATAFLKYKITPKYVAVAPEKLMKLKSSKDNDVCLGNKMFPEEWTKKPQISYDADPDSLYTFIMIDPDAPYGPMQMPGAILHCVVANIKGNDISTGKEIVPFLPVTPPPGSPPHRYIQLLYQHDDPLQLEVDDAKMLLAERMTFELDQFVDKHVLGDPVCGNFFMGYPMDNEYLGTKSII